MFLQKAEASDDDEEGKALMIKPGTTSGKEEKENDAFFKKVRPDKTRSVNQAGNPDYLHLYYKVLVSNQPDLNDLLNKF